MILVLEKMIRDDFRRMTFVHWFLNDTFYSQNEKGSETYFLNIWLGRKIIKKHEFFFKF